MEQILTATTNEASPHNNAEADASIKYQCQFENLTFVSLDAPLASNGTDVTLPNIMPQAEYMYGCTPTAVGMLLGYYDLYGYKDKDFSALIEGDIDIHSRGTDGNIYNMNEFDTVLGSFIASVEYVYRFFSRDDLSVITASGPSGDFTETTPAEEFEYSFVDGGTTLDTSVWNCLADYLGTGQYWRGQDNFSTAISYSTLEGILDYDTTTEISGDGYTRTIDYRFTSMLYGLHLYVQSRGFELDTELTGSYETDNNGGEFTFEDYMREIDAGRPVIVSITGHSMIGYGYNADTREIIFDDTYEADKRMVWDESYFYSGQNRELQSITVIAFRTQAGNRDLAFEGSPLFANHASAIASSPYFFAGDTIYLSFSAVNEGDAPSGSFHITLNVDGAMYDELEVTNLQGSESLLFQDHALEGLAAGTHQIEIILDSDNSVEETTASNNKYTATIQVLPEGMQVLSSGMTLTTGQTASNTLVIATKEGGNFKIGSMTLNGGHAENIILQGYAISEYYGYPAVLTVLNGGTANQVETYEWGRIYVSSGGTVENAVLHSGGVAMVYSGGSMANLTFEDGGYLTISGGAISGMILNQNGYAELYGGEITNATLNGTLDFYGSQGGILSSATINGSFNMRAYGGAVASDIVIGSSGHAYIYSSGLMKDVSGNGRIFAAGGATIRDAEILTGGLLQIGNRGNSEDATLHANASQYVSSGGTALRTSAAGGWLNVQGGGLVSSATIGSGGSMSLRDNAIAKDLTVEQGGIVYSWSHGYIQGQLAIGGRVQDVSADSVAGVTSYVFNVQTQMGEAFLEFSSGGIAANANITINVGNAWGEYTLVKGDLANLATATITVKSDVYSSNIASSGSVTLGDGRTVQLAKSGNDWTLSVSGTDNTPPAAPANITSNLLDNNLCASWQAVQDFSGVKYEVEYSRDANFTEATSLLLTEASFELPLASGTWHWRVRSVDGAGNTSPWSNANEVEIDYVKHLSGKLNQRQTSYSDVTLDTGASITAGNPACLQWLTDGFNVTLQGYNSLSCSGYRNANILFAEDPSWGDYYDGTVTFAGTNITLHSEVSNCITAAGIRGNNLTVNFVDAACGAESIVFEASNGTYGPGQFAAGVQAAGTLTVNGDFGGTISCVMDNSDFADSYWVHTEGFYAIEDLDFNGDMNGTIYLANHSPATNYAYGLFSNANLTVNGDIGGLIMANASDCAYALYGRDSITASISGTLFAGTSTEENNQAKLTEKLRNFNANKEELLELSQDHYSVYTQGAANISLTDNALLIGKIYAGSGSQFTISAAASFYGDIYTYYSTGILFKLDDASLAGTRLALSSWNTRLSLTVDAGNIASNGTYSLVEAASLSSISGITLMTAGETSQSLKLNKSVTVEGITYSLATQTAGGKQTLALTVSGIVIHDTEAPVLTGQVQALQGEGRTATLSWNEASDNVGVAGYELNWDGDITQVTQTSLLLENITAGLHTVQVRAFDAEGNYSDWTAEQNVEFIDNKAPVLVSLSPSTLLPTNENVFVTATYTDDFGVCDIQYRIADGDWKENNEPVEIEENTTLSFRAIDASENVSEITQLTISNIDKVPPVISNVKADVTELTNGNVTVTAEASDNANAVTLFYSKDGVNYIEYPVGGVVFEENGNVVFQAV
ncbi:MAG: hypothetical protein J5746_02610, partial [Victivallales bacterium]|nr:hypothetical protein [Victivallales bacterium]